jgi:predicted RND superfamily exporter protein
LVTAVLAAGLPGLRTEFGYRVLVGDEPPSVQALDALIEQFGGGMPVQIVWECGSAMPCATVFDRFSLEMAESVTRALTAADRIESVTGPSNAPLLVPSAGGFDVRRLVENGKRASDADALATRALEDSLWVGGFVSADATVGAIVVQPTDTESETDVRVVEAIEEAIAPFEALGFEYYLVGPSPEIVIGGRALSESTARIIPIEILVVAAILLVTLGSLRSVLAALTAVGLALVWTFGLLGWLDWPQDGILEVLAPLILVVGVCDSVHILSRYAGEVGTRIRNASTRDRDALLLKVVGEVGPPCLMTTATTAAAFVSFATSSLGTFVRFGLIAAFGVFACLLLTFTLLPLLVRAPSAKESQLAGALRWDPVLMGLLRISERHSGSILTVTALLFIVCGVGWVGFLRVDTNWYETYGEDSEIVRSIEFVQDRLRPADTLEIQISLAADSPVEDPTTLRAISEFSESLTGIEGLGSATSIIDLLKRVNRLLHDDDPAFEYPAETERANSEILELLGFEDPSIVGSWLSFDRSNLRVSVRADELSYVRLRGVLEAARDRIRSKLPPGWGVLLSGEVALTFDWIRDVQGTQIRSFPTAFALVCLMVAVFLRSVRLALAAMVPTLLPIVVTLGVMGWAGMSLDVARAMIAAVLMGIAVDDGIYLTSAYKRRRDAGCASRGAIRGAVLEVGRAVVTTSLALSLGFLTLMGSAWHAVASFGVAVALAIIVALGAALLVLPAMIFAVSGRAGGVPAGDTAAVEDRAARRGTAGHRVRADGIEQIQTISHQISS